MKKTLLFIAAIFSTGIVFSQTATTTVNPAAPIMSNPKLLLGISYDCRSSLSLNSYGLAGYHNTNGTFIKEVDSVFKDFPMSTLRYPANGIMQGFQWKKSIGPIANRPSVKLFAGSTPAQAMEFGFDEFMAMTTTRGVQPKDVQIMVPIYDSSNTALTPTQKTAAIPNMLQSNADWVEYANAPNDGSNPGGGVDWAAVRAANNHPLPYGIKIWNMGNEPYSSAEYTNSGAANYISAIVPVIDAMRAIDPTIQITVTVPGKPFLTWTQAVLNSALLQGKIYGINAHYFLTEEVVGGSIPQGVSAAESYLSPLAAAAQSKGYKLIVGDQAHYITSTSPTPAEQDLAMQWQGANLAADLFLAMSQIKNLERSDFWVYGLTSAQWHPIRKNSPGSYTLMPVADLYKKLSPLFLDQSISVTNTSPAASDGNPYSVRSSAFASSDNSKLNIIAVNRDKANTIPLQINGMSGYTLSKSKVMTAAALSSETILENPITANNGNYSMPPMSILVLEYFQTTVGINEGDMNGGNFNIYPNPTNSVLNIEYNQSISQVNKGAIYDYTGKELKVIQLKNDGTTLKTDVSFLPKGIYLLMLHTNTSKYSKRFIID